MSDEQRPALTVIELDPHRRRVELELHLLEEVQRHTRPLDRQRTAIMAGIVRAGAWGVAVGWTDPRSPSAFHAEYAVSRWPMRWDGPLSRTHRRFVDRDIDGRDWWIVVRAFGPVGECGGLLAYLSGFLEGAVEPLRARWVA